MSTNLSHQTNSKVRVCITALQGLFFYPAVFLLYYLGSLLHCCGSADLSRICLSTADLTRANLNRFLEKMLCVHGSRGFVTSDSRDPLFRVRLHKGSKHLSFTHERSAPMCILHVVQKQNITWTPQEC